MREGGSVSGGITPLLGGLLDDLMPTLKDTELRVLLIVLRETLGRHPVKEADWLSHRQLRARTGRASEAVSSAVDRLVRRGLIAVSDRTGRMTPTPADRRRCRGRLYYRPGMALTSLFSPKDGAAPALPQDDKPKTTKDKENKGHFRKPDLEGNAPLLTAEEQARVEAAKAKVRERLSMLITR